MNKLNNKRIIVVTVCVIAFLALFFQSDNSIAPIIAEQSSTITSAEVDISLALEGKNPVLAVKPQSIIQPQGETRIAEPFPKL